MRHEQICECLSRVCQVPPGGQLRFITKVPGRQGDRRGEKFGFERAHIDVDTPVNSGAETNSLQEHTSTGISSSSSGSSSGSSSSDGENTGMGANTIDSPTTSTITGTAVNDEADKVQYVPATTVDALVATHLRGRPPSVLSIDTEGFDPLVLRGAAQTLASGRVGYLEFEYHRYAPWKHLPLNLTIAQLDGYGYECYWAQPVLVPMTCFQWDKFGGAHEWSNVVCAHRRDACWSNALKEAATGP